MKLALVPLLLALATPFATMADKPRTLELSVTEKGFEPDKITVKKGEPVHLLVTRKTDKTCATEIDVKDLGVHKELPLDKAVAIDFTPQKTGEIRYVCGMNMFGGVLLVQ